MSGQVIEVRCSWCGVTCHPDRTSGYGDCRAAGDGVHRWINQRRANPGPDPDHTCHAKGCNVKVDPSKLMCRRHWKLVPEPLRTAVWATYRRGQEIDKRPSPQYLAAAQAAIDAVAEREARRRPPTLFDAGSTP